MQRQWVLALGLALTAPALAQSGPAQGELEHTWLDPLAQGSLLVGNGETAPAGTYRVSAALLYSHGQLTSAGVPVVRERFALHVLAGVGVTDWLELSADLPLILSQTTAATAVPINGAGLATPFLNLRLSILDGSALVAVSAALGVGLPIGSRELLGNGGVAVTPRITFGRVFERWMVGFEVGGLVREQHNLSNITGSAADELGSTMSFSAMIASIGEGLRTEGTVHVYAPLTGGEAGAEFLVGVRYPLGSAELYALGGPGVYGRPDTALFRLYLGVAYGNVGPPHRACIEGTDYELLSCPDLDKDGDGVPNGKDLAPLEPEDKDGFADDDGKPDPDNDADGILDVEDRCPMEQGPRENQGCPDVDTDGDGVVDRLDLAPLDPEDKDGFEDDDGKPDPDNDGDGFLDARDACPGQAGIPEERGCPPRDEDADGVPNHLDNCRSEFGPAANQGCPLSKPQQVALTHEALVLKSPVTFAGNSAVLEPRSFAVLDQVAHLMRDKTFIALLRVEGHTDNKGDAEKHKVLSQARAEAVVAYLVKAKVAAARLVAVGVGAERPLESNDTAKGREANNRVELHVVLGD